MKTTTLKLNDAVAKLTRAELEQLAKAVVWSLFAQTYHAEDAGTDEELDALNLEDGDPYLDTDKEWSADTVAEVSEDLDSVGLLPDQL